MAQGQGPEGNASTPPQLIFVPVKTKKDIENLIKFDLEAFSALPEVDWSLKGLQKEIEGGWEAMSVSFQNEIVAAVLVKKAQGLYLTKTTSIKLAFQGNGFSHIIKESLEEMALSQGIQEVRHYCHSDNFRLIALNEGHGYKKMANSPGKNGVEVEEWIKKLPGTPRGKS